MIGDFFLNWLGVLCLMAYLLVGVGLFIFAMTGDQYSTRVRIIAGIVAILMLTSLMAAATTASNFKRSESIRSVQ